MDIVNLISTQNKIPVNILRLRAHSPVHTRIIIPTYHGWAVVVATSELGGTTGSAETAADASLPTEVLTLVAGWTSLPARSKETGFGTLFPFVPGRTR